ncbi:MAG: hypothetical protein QHH27_04490 [Clostridia bacterium]|nr:hypothetical protein [Clostridia bacterium]MDH7572794.1 hypothetical protein [Clostridia bacterium]
MLVAKHYRPPCPVCGSSRQVGQVGTRQFFCWNCLLEYNHRREVFSVAEDGTLIALQGAGGEDGVV